MIRSEKAVSEVIGMVIILSIMMLVIGIIMVAAVPMIESSKLRARMDVASNSFLSMQNDIEEVVRGPIWIIDPSGVTNINRIGPSRETEFELMGGTITVKENKTNVRCSSDNCSKMVNNFSILLPPSNITYEVDNEIIAYENGAVIRQYESGAPLMLSNPLISIYNNGSKGTIISIHAITINGTSSSTGGDGKGYIETRLMNYSEIIPAPSDSPNLNQTNITIFSKYPVAWKNFFEGKLIEAGLVAKPKGSQFGYNISIGKALEVQIYGKDPTNQTKDIFLSVYETRLDVRVR